MSFPGTTTLKEGTYRGYPYRVKMGPMSINGYCELPEGHPWNDRVLEVDDPSDVHGGITFQSENVIGFDTCHAGDSPHPDSSNGSILRAYASSLYGNGEPWEAEDVKMELFRLIDQAKDAE